VGGLGRPPQRRVYGVFNVLIHSNNFVIVLYFSS
jgi:hypothetical protein